jgi:hypothetical protein
MKPIRAIETEYRGYKMRSRLEARWATFFDALDIPWEYEPEGYEDGATRYLPDFWMPTLGCFAEVKPTWPDEAEQAKAHLLVEGTGKPLYFLIGTPVPFRAKFGRDPGDIRWEGDHGYIFPGEGIDGRCGWGECACCGRVDLALDGIGYFESDSRLLGRADWCEKIRPNTARLLRAYRAARSARFEQYPPRIRRALEDAGHIGGTL